MGVGLATGQTAVGRLAFLEFLGVIAVLDHDRTVAEAHAELLVPARREGRPRGAHDLIIAATAKAANRLVVSADAAAFTDLPSVQLPTHRRARRRRRSLRVSNPYSAVRSQRRSRTVPTSGAQ